MKPIKGQIYTSFETGKDFRIISTTNHFGTTIYNCEDVNNTDIVFGFGIAFFDVNNNMVGTHTLKL
jgi:hypothetical protein